MDMDQIRTFVSAARLGSFGRAADALHRSQPAISRRIELLELELDVPVFERTRGGVLLTDAGAVLLPYAEAALAAAKDGLEAVAAIGRGEGGQVSLALVGTLANAHLTGLLKQFRERHPKIRLDLRTATSEAVGDLVLRGEATLGLRYLADRRDGLLSEVVTNEEMRVVCSPDHRLADMRRRQPHELRGERWVAFASPRGSRESFVQFLERRLRVAGVDEAEIIPVDGLTAQKRLVEAGFGLALLARSAIDDELRSGSLKIVDVPALQASVPVVLVHRRDGYLGTAAKSLLAMLRTYGVTADGAAPRGSRAPTRQSRQDQARVRR